MEAKSETKIETKSFARRVPFLVLGASIMAFGLYNVHSRCAVTEGGILGMSLLLKHWFNITPGISEPIMDLICYSIGLKVLGKDFLKCAIVASGSFALSYNFFELFDPVMPNLSAYPLVAAIVGALFVGIGVGIVVRQGGAAGGDDALALVISKLAHCKIAKAYLATDLTVLALSLSYIPFRRICYSLVTVTLSSYIIDFVQNYQFSSQKVPQMDQECAEAK